MSDHAQALISELRSSRDWLLRRSSALHLARHPGPGVIDALSDALDDRDPDVRHASVLALGSLGDPNAIDAARDKVIQGILHLAHENSSAGKRSSYLRR